MSLQSSCCRLLAVISCVFLLAQYGSCQEPACCDQAGGSCANACKQFSLAAFAADPEARESLLRPLHTFCPVQLESFWQCMNQTTAALLEGAGWEGRYCCTMAQTRPCQISCLTAQRTSDLARGCRKSDETAVYHCLAKQESFEKCCGQSKKVECGNACRQFLRDTPQPNRRHGLKKRLNAQCERDQAVMSCVSNLTHATPIQNPEKSLHCCSKGRTPECQEACRKAYRASSSAVVVMEILLDKGCGEPRPDDVMWGCFLQHAQPKGTELPSKIDRLGMDAAKLHCCHRASSLSCKRLCHKTYSRDWTGQWSEYDQMCLSAQNERQLKDCVDEVEEPCELGCDGLNFCSAFNNRPSELFRRCNPAADLAARQQFEQWKSLGYIPFMEDIKLPLKDIAQCATEKWKAVACALQLRPCNPRNHASMICRSDCNSLLHECVNLETVVMTREFNIKTICEVLSPPPGQPCISLAHYVQQPKNSPTNNAALKFNNNNNNVNVLEPQITRPCKNHPCNSSETCQVNRKCVGGNCESYTCSQGCTLGEVSRMIVSPNTWVRIPVEKPGCQRLCHCGGDGRMESCLTSTCESQSKCWLGRQYFDHGTNFWLDCNLCSCRSGELICSKRHCAGEERAGFLFTSSTESETEVALPCNCPLARSPVCGSNGKTYHSACLAKCSGLSGIDISPGECTSRDPCEGVSCGNGRRCIRMKRICLLPLSKQCRQFQCVPLKCEESWHKSSSEPVCDTHGRQHRNLCSLITSGSMLAYPSPCVRTGCSHGGPVCGIDGEAYPSECAAEARGIPKDYNGPCRFVAVGEGENLQPACEGRVQCPELTPNCIGVTPPGACCPICGGVLRILYSPHQVLRLAEVTEDQLVSVDDISKRLNSLIQTAQCMAGAYLGIGTELVVVVRPVMKTWTRVQLQACISESERVAAFIMQQNPVVQVDAALSVLTAAVTSHVSSGSSSISFYNSSCCLIISLFYTLRHYLYNR